MKKIALSFLFLLAITSSGIDVTEEAFPFILRGIDENSVANYSFLNHKPAGLYGYPSNQNGDFVFDNGVKIRWFGLNIVASRAFPRTHQEADDLAVKFAGLGINIVRIHHLTANWQTEAPFYIDPQKSTLEFNDSSLERLDYFLAALKKQGIYVTNEIIDSSLTPTPQEISTQTKLPSIHSIKVMMLIDPETQNYVKKWIKAFYCRKNRYTGLSLFEDPQLSVIGIVNELSIAYHNGKLRDNIPTQTAKILENSFKEYLKIKQFPEQNFDFTLRDPVSACFWDETLKKSFSMWSNYIRSLGYRGLISGSNFGENLFHHASSTQEDFMDAHLYWGFASYMDGVDKKTRFVNGDQWNDLVKEPRNENAYTKELFARFSMSSIPGQPLISSEHRTSIRNFQISAYRAAGLPFFSTIQAFQEWDGFYVFASQGSYTERIGHRLDVIFDTSYLSTFPLSSYLLRGDVISKAQKTILLETSYDDIFANTQKISFLNDALFYLPEQHKLQIAYPWMHIDKSKFDEVHSFRSMEKMQLPAQVLPEIIADTGEFRRNWKEGFFVINTDKVQGCEGFFNTSKNFTFKDIAFSLDSNFGVFFVSAGKYPSIAQAKRLLFTVAGSSFNSGDISKTNEGWSAPGIPPVLQIPLKGRISFNNNKYSIWALNEFGKKQDPALARGVSEFIFNTAIHKTIWYELELDK